MFSVWAGEEGLLQAFFVCVCVRVWSWGSAAGGSAYKKKKKRERIKTCWVCLGPSSHLLTYSLLELTKETKRDKLTNDFCWFTYANTAKNNFIQRWEQDEKTKDKHRWTQLEMTFYILILPQVSTSASWWFITDIATPACKHPLVCLSVQCVCTLSSLMLVLHWALCHCQPFYLHHGLHIRLGEFKSKWMVPV